MDPEPSLDALVAPLREDVVSGASQVAAQAAEIARRAARELPAGSVRELEEALTGVGRRILAAQPAMAPLVALVGEVLRAAEAEESVTAARAAADGAASAFTRRLAEAGDAVAHRAQALLPAGTRVATLSSSGAVRSALLLAARTKPSHVTCFEGRPMYEGRALAAELAGAGLEVRLAVDAAVHALVPTCDVLLLGADSIGDAGVVNKIGSAAAARAARDAGIGAYVLADTTKLLPRGWPQPLDDDRPPAEVCDAPAGVRVWNRYFEAFPLELLDGVVMEGGIVGREALQELRRGLVTPRALRES